MNHRYNLFNSQSAALDYIERCTRAMQIPSQSVTQVWDVPVRVDTGKYVVTNMPGLETENSVLWDDNWKIVGRDIELNKISVPITVELKLLLNRVADFIRSWIPSLP